MINQSTTKLRKKLIGLENQLMVINKLQLKLKLSHNILKMELMN